MKHILLITVVFTLISCGNNKAHVVDELKRQKDSLAVAQMTADGYSHAATHLITYKTLTAVDTSFLNDQGYKIDSSAHRLDSVKLIWETKAMNIKTVVDSLELELKKY